AGEHQGPHAPVRRGQAAHEPAAHLAGCPGDQHQAAHGALSPCCGCGATVDQSSRLKLPTESSREASSQITTLLPARRSSPLARVLKSACRVAYAPASFCAMTSTSRSSARASCAPRPALAPQPIWSRLKTLVKLSPSSSTPARSLGSKGVPA